MTGDQNAFLTFPPDAGQVCFKGSGEIHCLSYGAITSPIVASGGNQHAAKPPDGMSLQRCPGKRVKLRLRLKRKSKRAVKAALLAGRKLKPRSSSAPTGPATGPRRGRRSG